MRSRGFDLEASNPNISSAQTELVSRQEMNENFSKVFDMLNQLAIKNVSCPPPPMDNSPTLAGECGAGPNDNPPASVTAPSFLPVAMTAGSVSAPMVQGIQRMAGLGATFPLLAPGGEGLTVDHKPAPSVSVSSGLPPVLGHLVERIKNRKFVEFMMLRPINLKKLPAEELGPAQHSRLILPCLVKTNVKSYKRKQLIYLIT